MFNPCTATKQKPAVTRAFVYYEEGSLPLNRRRRLARHVISNARNALDLIDDTAADSLQQFVRQVCPTSGHEVDGFYGTQGHDPCVTTAIAYNANGFHWLDFG